MVNYTSFRKYYLIPSQPQAYEGPRGLLPICAVKILPDQATKTWIFSSYN